MKNTVTTALCFIERHRKAASGAALVLAVLLLFAIVNSPAVVGASATRRSLPVYSVERDGKFVALSFDAAWGNEDTEQLIEILQKYDVTATFFLVGQWVDKYPESVKQLSDAGMEVMNHSNDHAHFAKLSASEIVENVNACNAKIEEITGLRPTLFRCPYGEYDDNVIAGRVADNGASGERGEAGLDRAVPQRGGAHAGGAAGDNRAADSGRVHDSADI